MFAGKCAYCESAIIHVMYPHIEHFKPKSNYPELCFEWNNLLLACGVCNGARFKGDKFPESSNNGPFVNPVSENPELFFDFDWDNKTGIANILPKNGNPRGATTIKEIGLNRMDLVRHRSKVVRKMVFIAICAKKGDASAKLELFKCTQPDEEYSAFAKMLYRRFIDPTHL